MYLVGSVFGSILVLILILIAYIITHTTDDPTILVHVIFRHGERSPSRSYTNDPYKDHEWPGGWDELSTVGKKEEYLLGLELRKRYKSYLPEEYHKKDIYIQSSYADRCIMSAQLLLAGLYIPVKDQIWSSELPWQPIPVHSIPRYIDNKIAIKRSCFSYSKALQDFYNSSRMKEIDEGNDYIYKYLTEYSGDTIANISTVETLYNTLEIESKNNLILPHWANTYWDRMKNIGAISLASYTDTPFMKRMHGGVLAKEIISQMQLKANGKLNPDRKMFLYSGHDLTIVSILRVFGFEDILKPEFGAAFIIELIDKVGVPYVKFYYKSDPKANADEITLTNCNPCALSDLKEILKSVQPNNWEEECKL